MVEPSDAEISSDARLLPDRQLDKQIGLTRQFAEALVDRRHSGYIDHTFLEMTRMRVYGVLADYPDQNGSFLAPRKERIGNRSGHEAFFD